MFNAPDRLPIVVDMILAESVEDRREALNRLLPIQRDDFVGIFKAMSPYPVTIRLLDPPIHEFLPLEEELHQQLDQLSKLQRAMELGEQIMDGLKIIDPDLHQKSSQALEQLPFNFSELDPAAVAEQIDKRKLMLRRARQLREINPMLGHRGVRLSITYPEIYEMQIRAILEAAAQCKRDNVEIQAEIMVPQVAMKTELEWVKGLVEKVEQEVEAEHGVKPNFLYGTMIEAVRACVTANEIASVAEFFSFGTNDLTQATFSFSREDAENKFLPNYQEHGLLPANPFEALDVDGVGGLLKMGVDRGRSTQPELKVGICGEHGGHPASIRFCDFAGLDYVSCSGPRVPIARLAAAQANLAPTRFDV
jgi:pyruvate,orthophosphate dikinase